MVNESVKHIYSHPSAAQSYSNTSTDAVHPMFKAYKLPKDQATSSSDDLAYHCRECSQYFPMTPQDVHHHFDTRTHMPVDSCVYCDGPVCQYFHNDRRLVFHTCDKTAERVPPRPENATFLYRFKRLFVGGGGGRCSIS